MITIMFTYTRQKRKRNFLFFFSKLCCVLQIDVTAMIWYIELNFTHEYHTEY